MQHHKLWAKDQPQNKDIAQLIEKFTVGKDKEFDILLAKYDIIGNKAHVAMLTRIGFITEQENFAIQKELDEMYVLAKDNLLLIDDGIEDIHSQIELNLTHKLGDCGKKIHTGRSRNDQVLLDLKLFLRHETQEIAELTNDFFTILVQLAHQYKDVLMPGYTHYQIGMPSSFGLWFSAFAESLSDDFEFLQAAYSIVSKNPLGSGAGYGSSFPLDRDFTTQALGLKEMNINSIYAQMTRGKSEKMLGVAIAAIAATISKLANDICLFSSQNFGFFSFPTEITTGSSIMPHKKNPDVFELIRAKSSRIQAVPNELTLLMNNLFTGYNRDYQLTKEIIFPAIQDLKDCLEIFTKLLPQIKISENILNDEKYNYLFSVEKINELVLEGKSFRDAYREVGNSIEDGTYDYEVKNLKHTHKGSIGNLCLEEVTTVFNRKFNLFNETS